MPAVRPNQPLERGQTTILSTLNGGISIQRPPPQPRPGPVLKASGQANTVLGRHLIGGQNERQIIELFATVRLGQDNDGGEPGDIDIANGRMPDFDDSEEEEDYTPKKRYQYSQEHKLAAIDYFQTTWRLNKDETYERISNRSASKKLKIARKLLRNWVANKERIQNQRRGTFWASHKTVQVQEPELEQILNNRFEKARDQGRKISYKWMIRHARKIYEEPHPTRVVPMRLGRRRT